MKKKNPESKNLSELVVKGMLEKKAQDIVVMDLREIKNAIADYFIICSGTSDTQVEAISDSIEETVSKEGKVKPFSREGKANQEWVLIDYFDVVVHVFKLEKRLFYGLEDLWGDAKIEKIQLESLPVTV